MKYSSVLVLWTLFSFKKTVTSSLSFASHVNQVNKYTQKWYNVIVDISHWQNNVNLHEARNDGIKAVIHKATEGLTYTDPRYSERTKVASDLHLHWGAYHFGRNESGIDQAKHFLNITARKENTDLNFLPILDIESVPGGAMTPQQAEEFVLHVQDVSGRLPVIYSNRYFLDDGGYATPTLTACPLWIAQWTNNLVLPKGWSSCVMWQYTDGANGPTPHNVTGIGPCDRTKFNGTRIHFDRFWLDHSIRLTQTG